LPDLFSLASLQAVEQSHADVNAHADTPNGVFTFHLLIVLTKFQPLPL